MFPLPSSKVSRRSLIASVAAAAGGLVIGFRFLGSDRRFAESANGVEILNWITIAPDNTITIRIAQTEMGQGAITAMAQLLTEELAADWRNIRTEYISIAKHLAEGRVYGRTETSASAGLRKSENRLRIIGAQIRIMLIRAAAERLGVPESELVAEDSIITHRLTGNKLTYGGLTADVAKVAVPDAKSLELKQPKDWRCIGRSMRRLDIPGSTDGSAIFGFDLQLPGMKYAAIQICPVFGGTLKSYKAGKALSRPGVHQIVEIKGGKAGHVAGMDDALAVIADDYWQALQAVNAISIEWKDSDWVTGDSAAILANLRSGLSAAQPSRILRQEGDVETALSQAARTLEAEYFVPYLEPATMEPMNCTALVTDQHFELWAPTQHPEDAIRVAARVAGLPVKRGELHLVRLGGGFGRRIACDFVSQAIQVAKAMKGVPVKLCWTREDTMRHSFYRQASLSRFRGGIAADGSVLAWEHRITCQQRKEEVAGPFGADTLLYSVPNVKIDFVIRNSFVPAGPMRGVGYTINCFGIQSFIDELAAALSMDTYAFQRSLLDPLTTPSTVPTGESNDGLNPSMRSSRLRTVLDEVAQKANWDTPLGTNRGRGIAAHEQGGAYYAIVAEVTLDGKGWFTIDRIVVAADPGRLANPANARAQIEGSVAYGLTAAMYGEITLHNGGVKQRNFSDYQILRIDEMPEVEIHWVLDRSVWGDVSQSVVSPVQPALTNAIFNAGGPRIRSLPIKNHRIFPRDAKP